jgi:type IV pilus assembly protein PilC
MAEFLIKAADERGRLLQQVENGYSEAEVRDRLIQQGLLVYWVKPRTLLSGDLTVRRRGKVKQSQFVIFNQQFLTLIKAGLPILNSLDLLIKRQRNKYFQSLLQNVRDRVKGGELLSDAFAAQGAFPRIHSTTLLAGEKSGNMEEVLARYIAFQRLALTFKKKLAVSLVYPTLLITVVFGMMIFLVTYVVPQFAKLYEDMHARATARDYSDHAEHRHSRAGLRSLRHCRRGGGGGRLLVLAKNRQRGGYYRWRYFEASPAGRNLAKVSGGKFFPHALHSFSRRHAASAFT